MFLSFFAFSLNAWAIFRKPASTKPPAITMAAGVRGDLSGIYFNPAVAGTVVKREIFAFGDVSGLAADNFVGLMYAQPLARGIPMSLCVGAVYYDAGKMKFYYYGSEGFTEKTVSVQRDVMVFLTYGRQLNKQGTLFAGATVKGANSTIVEKFGAWAFAADLGLLYVSNFGFGAALSLQNLGYSTAFLSRREELPTMVTPSVSYTFVVKTFAISVSGDAGSVIFPQFMFTPAVGLDVTWFRASKPFISISGGYRFGLKDGNLQVGITIYSPFRFIDADLGYSYTHAVYLKPTHRLSLGIRF